LLSKYKVITTHSADRCLPRGTAAGFNRGYIRVLALDETYAGKFWGWEFDTLAEAQHFADFLRSPLPNWIASLQKEDSKVTPALSHIPLPDMRQPWSEQRLQQEFGLSDTEISFLQQRVDGVQQHISDAPAPTDSSSMAALRTFVLQDSSSAFMLGSWDWAAAKPQGSPKAGRGRKSASVEAVVVSVVGVLLLAGLSTAQQWKGAECATARQAEVLAGSASARALTPHLGCLLTMQLQPD
jgi:hypothetical protein